MMSSTPDRTRLRVVAAATVGNMVNMTCSVHAVFGTFLIPLSMAFGWRRAGISMVLGIIALAGAAIYPLIGRYADAHGARRVVLAGNLALAAAVAALAFSNGSLALFYATFAVIGLVGPLTSTAAYSKLIADWFEARRGTVLGFCAGVGNGTGATLMPVLAAVLLTAFGWRTAYLGIAAAVALIGFPILFWGIRDVPRYRHRDADAPPAAGMSLRQAARTGTFWLVLVSIASGAGGMTAVFSHVVPILAERGVGLAMGTSVLGVFALVCAGWQVAVGTMLDRASSPRIVAPMHLLAVLGLALLEEGDGPAALLAGGVLLGIGLGSQYGALPFLVARYFGLASFGTLIGAMYSAVVILQGVTPILLDHAFDVQGTYRAAVAIIGAGLVGGAALLLVLPRYREPGLAVPAAVAHV